MMALRAAVAALCVARGAGAEEVLVQGEAAGRRGQSRDDSVAGTVLTGPRLRAPGATGADVLRGLPGVTVLDAGGFGALSTASIRGATSAQTPVYLAGVRINDDAGGTADLSTVPLWMIERAEVYRGHAPIQADRLAIGGAIFFDPRRPKKPSINGGVTAGSLGLKAARLGATAGEGRARVLGAISANEAQNDYAYRDDRGTHFDAGDDREVSRRNADTRGRDLWLVGTFDADAATRMTAVLHGSEREQGVPGLGLLPTARARAALRRGLGAVRGERRCADGRCEVQVGTSALLSEGRFDDPLRELSLGGAWFATSASRVEQSASARVDVAERVEATAAANVAFERLSQRGEGAAPSSASRRFWRGAAGARWRGPVELHALGAVECNGSSGACEAATPGGRVGALGRLGRVEWLANAGGYGRAPTLGELHGTSSSVRGNPGLTPERGLVLDGGLRGGWSRGSSGASFELFAFAQSIAGLVTYRRSALGYLRPYNVGQSRTLGVEAAARGVHGGWLLAEVAATALDPRDTTEGRQGASILPFRSRLQVAPSLGARVGKRPGLGLDEATIELRYLHQSSRYGDGSGQVVLPSQGSLDVELSTWWLRRRVGASVRATNLLDQTRRDLIGYPLPGRAGFASLDLSWP